MLRIKTLTRYTVVFVTGVLSAVITTTIASAQAAPSPLASSVTSPLSSPIPGALACYSFEEGIGFIASDSSGNGKDGTIYGATWTTGKVGGALNFDGVNDYVSIPVINSDEISFCAWFYKHGIDTVNADALFGGIRNASDLQLDEGFDFKFFNSTPNMMRFILVTQDAYGFRTERTARYDLVNSVGIWYHVVGTYSKASGEQKLYIDGQLRRTSRHPVGNTIVPLTYFPVMKIGNSGTRRAYFYGIVDEVRFYNRPLTAQEVLDIYNGIN